MAGGDGGPDLDAVADELYGLAPSEFTAARDARAAEARRAGRRGLAEAVKRLRRPTAGAWLADLLARRAAEDLGRLLELGAALRRAQSELAGEALRRLSRQRQQVVSGLVAEALRLAEETGHPAGPAAARELQATLEAALADPGAADAVRSGRLATALRYSGLGQAGPATSERPVPAAGAGAAHAGTPADADLAVQAERARRAERAAAVAEARAALDAAAGELDQRRREADHAARRLEERRQQLASLEARCRVAREAVDEAEGVARREDRRRAAAAAALDGARARLAEVEAEPEG